jgi:pyridoxal phosphate enzyme (YggS family)
MSAVAERLGGVRARIAAACARAGRQSGEVELVAVSKLQPVALIREAYEAGQRHFGENYAQELRDKAEELSELPGIRWHALGSLQVNKCKYVARTAHIFHALWRSEVAQELGRRRTGGPLVCFVEINLGGETSKEGIAAQELPALLAQVRGVPHLEVVGLMALPPLGASAEASRPHFRNLRTLAQANGLSQLSMGTTHDFEMAVEEGATCVRVGEAIFGPRPAQP